jgi:hypothetical protein
MATYVPAKRATELIFYMGLVSQSTGQFQANPTLAAGDVKISKDGGALANLTTLPAVTPAGGKMVKVTVSSTEMTADNVTLVFSDAAGAEWDDVIINIQTAAQQIDDLATPTNITAGTITTVTNVTTVNGLAANVITAASIATDAITAAKVAADVTTEIQSGLATAAALATVQADTDNIQTRIPAALSGDGFMKADLKSIEDELTSGFNATLKLRELDIQSSTTPAIQIISTDLGSPAISVSSQGLSTAALRIVSNFYDGISVEAANDAVILTSTDGGKSINAPQDIALPSGDLDDQLQTIDNLIDTEVAAIKSKTDQLTFTSANHVDANIQKVNDVTITGDGSTTPWGPV